MERVNAKMEKKYIEKIEMKTDEAKSIDKADEDK